MRARQLRGAAWPGGGLERGHLRERGDVDVRREPRACPRGLPHLPEVHAEVLTHTAKFPPQGGEAGAARGALPVPRARRRPRHRTFTSYGSEADGPFSAACYRSIGTDSTTSSPNAWRWCSRFGLLVRTRSRLRPRSRRICPPVPKSRRSIGTAHAPAPRALVRSGLLASAAA